MEGKILNFTDLDAWKSAHELTLEIYKVTKKFPKDEVFGIISQIKRAAASISANIAEGFCRYYFKDKIRFYYQARGSASELQNFLILTKDLNYLETRIARKLYVDSIQVIKLINGLIRSIENQK